jgi:hypothetical protein
MIGREFQTHPTPSQISSFPEYDTAGGFPEIPLQSRNPMEPDCVSELESNPACAGFF